MERHHLSPITLCIGLFACFLLSASHTYAQELRCTVTINSDQVEGSGKSMFQTLQTAVTDFINNSTWTGMTFAEQERIECSLMIIVKQVTTDNMFTCEMQVQSRRPVYGTTYSTPLVNIKDNNFDFKYQEFDRLEYQQNTFSTNLTAMLAYYCYLIIGYDLDSYSRLGGTPCFQQCENIVNAAQSAGLEANETEGWQAFKSNRNRYALVNNLMDEAFKPYRNYYYEYHRLGLDQMASNTATGRAQIASGIGVLREAYRARPATYLVNTFLDAKNDELVNIFQQGTAEEKKTVYDVLVAIDPTRENTYNRINENH